MKKTKQAKFLSWNDIAHVHRPFDNIIFSTIINKQIWFKQYDGDKRIFFYIFIRKKCKQIIYTVVSMSAIWLSNKISKI